MSERSNAQDGVAPEQLIAEYVDGVLSPEQAAQVRSRMEADASFRAEVLRQQQVKQLLSRYRAEYRLAAAAEARILGRLQLIGLSYHLWHSVVQAAEDDPATQTDLPEVTPLSVLVDYYLDGELPSELHQLFRQQMAIDPELRKEVEEIRWLQDVALPQCLQHATEPAGHALHERVMQRLEAIAAQQAELRVQREPNWWRRAAAALVLPLQRYGTATVVAAAACVLIGSAILFWQQQSAVVSTTTPRPNNVTELPVAPTDPSQNLSENELEAMEEDLAWNEQAEARQQLAQLGQIALSRWSEMAAGLPELQMLHAEPTREPAAGARAVETPAPAAPAAAEEKATRLPDAVEHIGRILAWEDEEGNFHCAVVVDARQADETISLLCKRYDLALTRVDGNDAASAGKLMVLELPAGRAQTLLNEMQQRFQQLATRAAAKAQAAGPQPSLAGGGSRRGLRPKRERARGQAPAEVASSPAVTLPIGQSERAAILQLVDVVQNHSRRPSSVAGAGGPFLLMRRSGLSGLSDLPRSARMPASLSARTRSRKESRTRQGEDRSAVAARTDRVVVYLYFVFDTDRSPSAETPTRKPEPDR